MQPIYFYTQDFSLTGRLKKLAKRLLKPGLISGPEGVSRSLFAGLKGLGAPFCVNQKITKDQAPVAGVLNGVPALAWAIRQKQKGLVRSIVAGPNLVVTPEESGGLLKDPLIDKILVPSPWVKELYLSFAPELEHKIHVWPAGVSVPPVTSGQKKYDFLVYNKTGGHNKLVSGIEESLKAQNYSYTLVNYGKSSQAGYFSLLDQSRYLIYLSPSESQGLAMLEAWARNIPTLVWERGFYEQGTKEIKGNTASPYLSAMSGQRFVGLDDFNPRLAEFARAEFRPRDYVLENFTHQICAQKYLEILNA